jgi:signal transduction histidine kinase
LAVRIKNIFIGVIFIPLFFMLVLSIVLIYKEVYGIKKYSKEYSAQFKKSFLSQQRERVKYKVAVTDKFISFRLKDLDISLEEKKRLILKELSYFEKGIDNYNIFIFELNDINGGDKFAKRVLSVSNPKLVGTFVSSNFQDNNGYKVYEDVLKNIKENKREFVKYSFFKKGSKKLFEKESMFVYRKDLNWIIGVGFYYEDINKKLNDILQLQQIEEDERIQSDIMIVSFILFIFMFIAYYILSSYRDMIRDYATEIEDKNTQLKSYQKELENKVTAQVEEIRKKDKIMILNSRQMAIGDTMSNIAHQWRQPLNVLSLQKELILDKFYSNELDEKSIESYDIKVSQTLKELSKTIDDFRNLFLLSKNKENFCIKDEILSVTNMVYAELIDNGIFISLNCDNSICINGYKNEFKQVFLNMIQNSKESLINMKKQGFKREARISIDIKQVDDSINIFFSDNGIGIPEDIINKVFEPYFTTKFKSKGTGLGLYMCKSIIEEDLFGTIIVERLELGVCFKIKIPCNNID